MVTLFNHICAFPLCAARQKYENEVGLRNIRQGFRNMYYYKADLASKYSTL